MARRKCQFSEEQQKEFPDLKKTKIESEVYCTIFSNTITIANKGKHDLLEYINSKKQKLCDFNILKVTCSNG